MTIKRQRPRKSNKTGRNTAEAKHVRLYKGLLRSPAWQSLPSPAAKLLIEFYHRYDGSNNGDIVMSVRQAMEVIGCSLNHARKMLRELEDRGFIKPRQRGSFNWKKRHATTWILTEYRLDGREPTKDFMQWQPSSDGAHIQNTVSRGDTDGVTQRYRGSPKHPPTVSRNDTVKASSAPSTVSRGDTRLVYHGRCDTAPAVEPTKTSSSPSERSETTQKVGNQEDAERDQKRPDCECSGEFDGEQKAMGGRVADRRPRTTAKPQVTVDAMQATNLEQLQWHGPRMAEIPRGPRPSRFGPWLEQEGIARAIPQDYIADALAIPVRALQDMIGGRVQWSASQCRRAEAALAKFELGYPPRTRHPS